MSEELEQFIFDISSHNDLKINLTSKIIAQYYESIDFHNREAFYTSLHKLYDLHLNSGIILEASPSPIQSKKSKEVLLNDYRLHRILLSNLRGIPEKYNSKDYGISFENDDKKCQSMVLLGMNGTGKSSIYDALEYMYCGEIGEAKVRHNDSLKDDGYKEYLTRDNNLFSDLSCCIETMTSSFDIHTRRLFTESQKKKTIPETHFISESDIFEIGKCHHGSEYSGRTVHKVIAEKLGLSDFIHFNTSIKELVTYRRTTETTRLKNNKTDIDNLKKSIEQSQKMLDEQSEKLIKLGKSNKNSIVDENKKMIDILSNIKAMKVEISFERSSIEKALFEYYNTAQMLKHYGKVDLNKDYYNFLYQGLEQIKETSAKDCPFCGSSSLRIGEIVKQVVNKLNTHKEYADLIDKRATIANRLASTFDYVISDIERYKIQFISENDKLEGCVSLLPIADTNKKLIAYFDIILDNQFSDITRNFEFQNNELLDTDITGLRRNIEYIYDTFEQIKKALSDREQQIQRIEKEVLISNVNGNITLIESQAIIKNEIAELTSRISSQARQIEDLQKQTPFLQRQADIYHRIKEDISIYAKIVSREIDNKVTDAFAPIKDTVETILKEFSKDDNTCEVRVNKKATVDTETGEVLTENIVIDLYDSDNKLYMSPNKYYNGFRYKIFCLSVCVSLAIAARNKTKVNLPIIMDDILTCADFDHRLQFESFFRSVIDLFERHSLADMPLQLIYITHDELMYDSVFRVMTKHNPNTIAARLLDSSNAKEKEDYNELTYKISDQNIRPIIDMYRGSRIQA